MIYTKLVRSMFPRRHFRSKGDVFNRLLPQSAILVLKRHLMQFFGFLLLCFVFAMSLSLWSYSPDDPSFNTSFSGMSDSSSFFTVGLTQNYLQIPGAVTADLLLQGVGYGVFPLLICLFIWAILLLSGKSLRLIFWRLMSLVCSTLFFSQFLFYFKNCHTIWG